MNILWIVDHLGYGNTIHGAGKYYLDTIPRFETGSFHISLCVLRPRDELTNYFEAAGIDVHHLGRHKFDPLTLFDLVSLIRKKNIDLTHLHGYGAANFGRMASVICKIPAIIHGHDEDHNYPVYQRLADLMLSRFTDKAIAVSQSVKNSLTEKRRVREERVIVLNNGICFENFAEPDRDQVLLKRRLLGIKAGDQVIGTVGRLRAEKGIGFLLKSFPAVLREMPDARLLIVGDGSQRERLEALSRQLEIETNVIFAGFHMDVPVILANIDVVVIPSLTEGFPLALLEAMTMKKAVIATHVGGMKEILNDGVTGLLVPPGNHEALTEKIIYLLKNEELADNLRQNAQSESRKYDISHHVRRLEEYYALTVHKS